MNSGNARPENISRAVLLLPVVLLFYGLGSFGLLNNVEGMYAEISREMLTSHDWQAWVIPHLNGLPYIEKPPLLYWIQAIFMALFGVTDVAARLVPTLASLASMLSLWWYGRRLYDERFGLVAAFVLGTSLGFAFLCKIGMTDPLLSACFTAALLSSHLAWVEQRNSLLRWAMVWLALAVLTKGFVALALYAGVWGCYLIFSAGGERLRLARFLLGFHAWGVFLLVAAPWHLAAAFSLEGFTWFYFINEHVLRFLGLREPRDYYSGSPLYYLPRLFLMAFPWCLVLLVGLVARLRGRLINDEGIKSRRGFLWAAVLLPLVFFSVSAAKANYYVLVCLPALALLVASNLRLAANSVLGRIDGNMTRVAIALSVLLLPLMIYVAGEAGKTEATFSARPIAAEILRRDGTIPVYLYQDYEDYSSLPFYLQRNDLGVVEVRSQDLAFALKRTKDPALYPTLAEFLGRRERAWVVVMDARVRGGMPPELAAAVVETARIGNATLYLRAP